MFFVCVDIRLHTLLSGASFSAKRNPQHCCGFFLKNKKPNLFVFIFENKKGKILLKNLGFYAYSGFLSRTHEANLSFSAELSFN
jgi:hypothetical protein